MSAGLFVLTHLVQMVGEVVFAGGVRTFHSPTGWHGGDIIFGTIG